MENPDTIVGTWLFGISGQDYLAVLTFGSDGSYQFDQLVAVGSNAFYDQEEKGQYAISGSSVRFTPKEWTCHKTDPATTDGFSLQSSGQALALTLENGTQLTFVRAGPSDAGAAPSLVTPGCYGADGGPFVQASLQPVSN